MTETTPADRELLATALEERQDQQPRLPGGL